MSTTQTGGHQREAAGDSEAPCGRATGAPTPESARAPRRFIERELPALAWRWYGWAARGATPPRPVSGLFGWVGGGRVVKSPG